MKFGDWANEDDEAVYEAFRGIRDSCSEDNEKASHVEPTGEILCAAYDSRDYSGEAVVILRIDGVLHEVYGSHCSCYGLEGQWQPAPIQPKQFRDGIERTLKELKNREDDGYSWYGPDLREAYRYIAAHMSEWGIA